jgi:transposase
VDAHRPKRDRRTALKLFGEIQAAGFTGDYSRVTEFVRRWRMQGGQAKVNAYIPLKFELGEAFQFDWSEEHLVIGGVWRKILAAHLKLCASRTFIVSAYPTQGHEMLFDAHTRAFGALGGIPRRGIYDNMKTAVDKVKKGKGRTVNTRFAAMASHYLFDPDFCNVASGWEKGVVEKNVQDSRRRIWQDAAHECFGSFTELNVWLLARCRALWQELRHPEFDDLTLAEMLEHEQPSLMPMVPAFNGYVETLGKVSSTSLVILDRNRYSVPCELVGQLVSLRLYPERVDIVAHDTLVASHPRSFARNQTCYDWQHYLPLIERKPGALRNGAPFADLPDALLRLRGLLLKQEGGDRIMAKVLAAVPTHGLEAVLVAVELVLESGNPSAEHVENVLNRLKRAPAVEAIETTLQVDEAPIADTQRYDSLREVTHA